MWQNLENVGSSINVKKVHVNYNIGILHYIVGIALAIAASGYSSVIHVNGNGNIC